MTPQESSVVVCLAKLQPGHDRSSRVAEAAIRKLWERYFDRLVRLANRKVRSASDGDGEDVALSVLASFYKGITNGEYPRLADEGGLWGLLVTLTGRKVCDRLRRRGAWRHGGRSAFEEERSLEAIISDEPTPEFLVELEENVQRLLDSLGNETLRRVALARMEGRTNAETAAMLNLSLRSVTLRVQLIRRKWATEGGYADA